MKNYVIIGCGRFGSSLAKELYKLGNDVLMIDKNMDLVQGISDDVTHSVQVDATDESAMSVLGLRNFDVAVVSISSDIQSSILATLIIKELGIPYVMCKAQTELQAKLLYKIGADRVVFPERDMGVRIAHSFFSQGIIEHIELDPNYSMVEIHAPQEWIGKNLMETKAREKYGITIVAIKSSNRMLTSPGAQDMIREGDIVMVIGENQQIKRLEKIKHNEG